MPHRIQQFNRIAFTLVEMLVVMALVGMLAAILSVALMSARRMSIRVECQGKLNQIGTAIHQLSLQNGGQYIELEKDGTPWWARVYGTFPGVSIDEDAATSGTQPPAQLPSQMQMFHCRLATALDNSGATPSDRLANLNETLSYGLNYDIRMSDSKRTPYECDSQNPDPLLRNTLSKGPRTTEPQDRDADTFNYTEVKEPSKFILLAEGNARELDSPDADEMKDATGFKVCAQKASEVDGNYALASGRHKKMANVLFLDLHVEAVNADPAESETLNVNLMTNLWTLPAD